MVLNSKEALERVKTAPEYCGENSVYKNYDNSYIPFMKDIELIEKDLDRLEMIEKALNEIAQRKPVLNSDFQPKAGGNNINDYIREITDYIYALSSSDNLVISAVYERFVRERKVVDIEAFIKEKENDK